MEPDVHGHWLCWSVLMPDERFESSLREAAEALVIYEGWRPPLTPQGRPAREITPKATLARVVWAGASDEWRELFELRHG